MISFLGLCVQNFLKTIKYLLSGNANFRSIVSQAAMISYDSLSISLIIVFVASAVITLQISKQFLMSGAESYVGGFIAVALVREIAPGFAALAIGARAGTAICAQVANMQVTEQIDAIKTLGVDPVGYYFAPRLIASATTVPMVVIIAEFLGVVGGIVVAFFAIGLHPNRFINAIWLLISTRDIYISILKAFIFGVLITMVCATQGYMTNGGAKDVGTATTRSAIKCTFYLLVADFLLNLMFYL